MKKFPRPGNHWRRQLVACARLFRRPDMLRYHSAHHDNLRAYLCGCMPLFRIGGRTVVPRGNGKAAGVARQKMRRGRP